MLNAKYTFSTHSCNKLDIARIIGGVILSNIGRIWMVGNTISKKDTNVHPIQTLLFQ